MNDYNSSQINFEKASSHPLRPGGVYVGNVVSFVSGRPTVFVQELGVTYTDVDFVGSTKSYKLKTGDQVLCTFINNETREIYVLGAFNQKNDSFVTVEKFNALIDALTTELNTIRAALVPPLPAINLTSLKQELP